MPAPLVLPMRQPVAAPMRTAAPVAPPLPTTLWNGVRFTIIKPGVWQDDQMRQWRPITASTTAYTWVDGVSVEPGKTAKRTCAKTTYGIASDWSVIKPGTSIWVPGYGIQSVDDKCGRSMKNWRTYREVVLDLRIPNQRHDGRWRSNGDIVQIATKHGYQRKRTVLVRINESL
jgi:3D (Asp-Asp-Asp) domain-containing protein